MFSFHPPSVIDEPAKDAAEDWPAAIVVENEAGRSDWVVVCEHASCHIPPEYEGLGLPEGAERGHIGWDIGAAELARALAEALDAPLALGAYSRLMIDLNRPLGAKSSIPEVSEGVAIPGNAALDDLERQWREERIFRPFHDRIAALLDARRRAKRRTRLVAVHSFTPVYLGEPRPWAVGVLAGASRDLASALLSELRTAAPLLPMELDRPYKVAIDDDYAIPVHGDARGLEAVLIELRNDELASPTGVAVWAGRLAAALGRV